MEVKEISKFVGEKIKEFRLSKNITQQEVAEHLKTTSQTVSRYENGILETNNNVLFALADYFEVSINAFFPPLKSGTDVLIGEHNLTKRISVFGAIKAGVSMVEQDDIIGYVDISDSLLEDGNECYGIVISDDSMYPKYWKKDVVIFEGISDLKNVNGQDCMIIVGNNISMFRNVTVDDNGINLVPFNLDGNRVECQPIYYNWDQLTQLPVKVIGVAREVRRKL